MEKLKVNEPDNMKTLLANTVYQMCNRGLEFSRTLTIKGLIVVSVDDEVFVVEMDRKFRHSATGEVIAVRSCDEEENAHTTNNSYDDVVDEGPNSEAEEANDTFAQPDASGDVSMNADDSDGYTEPERPCATDAKQAGTAGCNGESARNFLESFSSGVPIKLETTSDAEDANELFASINSEYPNYLEQENETSAMSSNSSPLPPHLSFPGHQNGQVARRHTTVGVNNAKAASVSSTSSSQLQLRERQMMKKDIFNYDEDGRRLKSFTCQYEGCTKAFFRKDHLTRHQRIKHGKPYGVESQNVYKCCGKTFYKHRSLLKHIKETHPERGDTSVLLVVHGNDCYESVGDGHYEGLSNGHNSSASPTKFAGSTSRRSVS